MASMGYEGKKESPIKKVSVTNPKRWINAYQ